MDRVEAQKYLRSHGTDLLRRDRSGEGFICPICGSGSGDKGTGITTKDGVHFTCWAGCFTSADVIDIFGQKAGATSFPDKLRAACEAAGVSVDPASSQRVPPPRYPKPSAEPREEYTEYYTACAKKISMTDYPAQRGLSPGTVARFNLGFDPEWRHPKALAEGKTPPATPRLIIPTSPRSYLARDTRANVPELQQKYSKSKVGAVHLFNADALKSSDKPVFVVEGEIDALSIEEVGGKAVALGSTANKAALLDALGKNSPAKGVILALDNDAAGEKASKDLEQGLGALHIPFSVMCPFSGYKDANEALQHDRGALADAIAAAVAPADKTQAEYLHKANAFALQDFINGIKQSTADTPRISTGFPALDNALDGGLYEGLHIMGAISSLGKTTLAIQVCDQIAASGKDVLIFSLEMARTELIAKSISRHTFLIANARRDLRLAKTARGITDGNRYPNYTSAEVEAIKQATEEYGEYAGRLYTMEGVGEIGVSAIRSAISEHITLTGHRPVVLVDYLQILAPYNDRATDKQNTDKAVLELKRLSRDFKIPVIAISSLNRMSYKDTIGMEAFKESGAIEYSADVLIGLELEGAGSKDFNPTEAKQRDPRRIKLVVLKARNAGVGTAISYEYYPKFNLFREK